jgi:hypothetical protein
MLVSEWVIAGGGLGDCVFDVIMNHRPYVHVIDLIAQFFLIVKILYNLYKTNNLFNYLNFVKLHLELSYSVFC